MTNYEKLEARFRRVFHLRDLQNIAHWDEAVVMPTGAGESRAEQLAELTLIMQELVTSPEVGDWIADAESRSGELEDWQRANLREMKRSYLVNTGIDPNLNQRLVMARTRSEQAWRGFRESNDWKSYRPILEEVLKLTREMLIELGSKAQKSIYDTALWLYSPGLTSDAVENLFDDLKTFIPQVTAEVIEKQKSEAVSMPNGKFRQAEQKALGRHLMELLGFDFEQGRLDESHHPFCGGHPRDVRITSRYSEDDFFSGLFGVLHETGHGLYEQNLPRRWLSQPAGEACGMAIHESQSLLVEMQVVRSPEFLAFAGPLIRKHFGGSIANSESLDNENLVALATRVSRSLIRVDADEVTYPAHVILRTEIEKALLEGKLQLMDLPEAWNEKMTKYLGLSTTGNDRDGCMQDVHWPSGAFGYFPAYTFGAVIAAQLFAHLERAVPDVRSQIADGRFEGLKGWLRDKIWSQGSKLDTLALVQAATGEPLTADYFKAHIKRRYLNS